MHIRVTAATVLALGVSAFAWAAPPAIQGRVIDPTGLPLPGVSVTAAPTAGGPASTTLSNTDGRYELATPPGFYRVTAVLDGFGAAMRDVIVPADGAIALDFSLALAPFQEAVAVHADASRPLLAVPQPNAPVTVTRTVIDQAMLPNSRYDDVLTLMPGVVRGPDNQISVGGARPSAGGLFVNGVNHNDPASGQPGLSVPIEAVESVQVFAGGYAAEFGPAAAGITSVQTRAGTDRFHASFDSMFPRLLMDGTAIRGVSFWDPNVGLSGPVVKGRVYFVEGLSFRRDRNEFTTVAGPAHSVFTAPSSWSQLDARIGASHHVRTSVAVDDAHTDHATLTAFSVGDAAPALSQRAWSATALDTIDVGHAALVEARASLVHTDARVASSGERPFDMGHGLIEGSYFAEERRTSERRQGGVSVTWAGSSRHVVKAGTTLGDARLDFADQNATVQMLRSDGTLSRRIAFLPSAPAQVATVDAAGFVQDAWIVVPWLTINAGVRYDRSSGTAHGRVSPRVAWTMKRAGGWTSVSGSLGLFADKMVLDALAFPLLQPRAMEAFDSTGATALERAVFANETTGPLDTPTATRWDLSLDRRLTPTWQVHVRYQEHYGRHEFVVEPSASGTPTGRLVLRNTGEAIARSIEATAGYRAPGPGGEFYLSYVWSAARGPLNSLDAVSGLFPEPFVQQAETGPLATDVPHRMLAWALVHLPAHITLAPFLDVRSGFPYSTIDDDWSRAGTPNGHRLPWFGSLDFSATTVTRLPGHLPHARVGVKLYNIASVHSERDVQRDIVAPDAGTRYNPVPRDFTLVCMFLLGR